MTKNILNLFLHLLFFEWICQKSSVKTTKKETKEVYFEKSLKQTVDRKIENVFLILNFKKLGNVSQNNLLMHTFPYQLQSENKFWKSQYLLVKKINKSISFFNQENKMVSSILSGFLKIFPYQSELSPNQEKSIKLHRGQFFRI